MLSMFSAGSQDDESEDESVDDGAEERYSIGAALRGLMNNN